MPKRANTSAPAKRAAVKLSVKDKNTLAAVQGMAAAVTRSVMRNRDPEVEIPMRSLSNTHYNASKRILQMGKKTTARPLFNLSSAKSFMQTMLVAGGTKRLIEQGKSLSIRGLYYMLKHKIKPTNEVTFENQTDSDAIVEDVEVMLGCLREEMHLYADLRGGMVGDIQFVDSGDLIDCSRLGSGGYQIPSIVEPEVIRFRNTSAKFILHVEKGTVWQRFNEDKFWKKNNCLLTHGAGQPSRGVRRMLHRLHHELRLPVYCLLDNDPWGYYIYSVIKQGSMNLAFESQRMAIPDAKFLGVRSEDFKRCGLADSVIIGLTDSDRKRARQIAEYPWFVKKKDWQKEIQLMLDNGFKLEVEALISRDISYVTEEYVPERLREGRFLD
ncbi:MAG TPA: DNA topoisomerase VI [Planctomycetaceae bacterium]|nr:DNA topoisomerase VI [Planctomycetaceae bacterium]